MRTLTSHIPRLDRPDVSPEALRRRRLWVKWLRLAGLAGLGVCTVSIPLTIAIVFTTTGASDVLTLGATSPKHRHETPAKAIAGIRCTPKRGYYALTFDDGPFASTTRGLVAALTNARAVATFFDVGQRAATREDLVELQRSVGQVANEGYSAPDLTAVSQARRFQELRAAAKVLDYPNVFFRPPRGSTDPAVEADVRRSGLSSVYWTVDVSAPTLSATAIVQVAVRVRPGGIIRLGDGREQTLQAVPGLVTGLRKLGMCPGLLARTDQDVIGPNGLTFHAVGVKP
jgi:peptidoglycan/xylan/chitin deacetylase (PgdA/CDA1 family)